MRDQKDLTRDKASAKAKAAQAQSPPDSHLDSVLYEEISKIADMLSKSTDWTCESVVNALLDHVIPRFRSSSVETSKVLGVAMRPHMNEMILRKLNNITEAPSATRLCTLHVETGISVTKPALSLITRMLETLCEMRTKKVQFNSVQEYQNMISLRIALFEDVLETWRILLFPRHLTVRLYKGQLDSSKIEWPPRRFHLPNPMPVRATMTVPEVDKALLKLFPEVANVDRRLTRIIAITTYTLLTDPDQRNPQLVLEAMDFLKPVEKILRLGILGETEIARIFSSHPTLRDYVLKRWRAIIKSTNEPLPSGHPREMDEAESRKALDMALSAQDYREAEKLWNRFKMSTPSSKEGRNEAALLRQIRHFLYVFMTLNATSTAASVWSHLEVLGLKPDVATWTSLLRGVKASRNAAAIGAVWSQLLESGTKPDATAWTTRISALSQANNHRLALGALDEMFAAWRNNEPGAVQPSIIHVNAALSGLTQRGMAEEAHKLVLWADKQDIKPDVFTFNMLLDLSNKFETISRLTILRDMTDRQVEPDDATLTLLVVPELEKMGNWSAEDQANYTKDALDEMAKAGMKANMIAYGKLIHVLMKRGQAASQAIMVVLEDIWKKSGADLSPHLYTILVDYYYSHKPPDCDAVEKMISVKGLAVEKLSSADRVFWERVIHGSAQAGRIDFSVEIWNKIIKSGRGNRIEPPVSLNVSHVLLQELVVNGMGTEAKRVVDTMVKWAGSRAKQDSVASLAVILRHRFFHLARHQGLFEHQYV